MVSKTVVNLTLNLGEDMQSDDDIFQMGRRRNHQFDD